MFIPALNVLFFASLRIDQLIKLKKGDLQEKDGKFFLRVWGKRARAANGLDFYSLKELVDPTATKWLRDLEKSRDENLLLYFPPTMWKVLALRVAIKDIATQLHWKDRFGHELKFDGPHCLRHGGIRYLGERLGVKLSTPEVNYTLQISEDTRIRYTRSNESRKAILGQKRKRDTGMKLESK